MTINSFILNLPPAELRTILLSHGWFDLPPFDSDLDNITLEFPYDIPAGQGRIKLASYKDKNLFYELTGIHITSFFAPSIPL